MAKTEERSIEASEWVGFGTGMLRRRDYLSPNHPESWPNLWLNKYGDLDGFPDAEMLEGFRNPQKGQTFFKCKHCNCANVVADDEMMSI